MLFAKRIHIWRTLKYLKLQGHERVIDIFHDLVNSFLSFQIV